MEKEPWHKRNAPPLSKADWREEIFDRIEKNDESAVPEFQKLLKELPHLVEAGGNLAEVAEQKLIEVITGKQLLFSESLKAKLDATRAELAGPSPSPVEKLLVERVVTCWLQVNHADAIVAQCENCTLAQGDYNQRRQDRAHRRFLLAVKTLATVRRLALPIRVDVKVDGAAKTNATTPLSMQDRWRLPLRSYN
jgi:hypothetical protein